MFFFFGFRFCFAWHSTWTDSQNSKTIMNCFKCIDRRKKNKQVIKINAQTFYFRNAEFSVCIWFCQRKEITRKNKQITTTTTTTAWIWPSCKCLWLFLLRKLHERFCMVFMAKFSKVKRIRIVICACIHRYPRA